VQIRRDAQKSVDRFAPREADLRDRIESLERELKTATAQRVKTEAYLAGQKAKTAELRRRLEEMKRLRDELEPFLDRTLDRLAKFVASDLPFLTEERRARLESLRAELNDYDAGLSQKTRRLLEALAVEARYGSTVDASEAEVEIDGRRRRVSLLRVGRLELFALSVDGDHAWRLDASDGRWRPVDDQAMELQRTADIAARRRVVSLVEIPLARPSAKEARP
jgi:chromosome segregation ATPase